MTEFDAKGGRSSAVGDNDGVNVQVLLRCRPLSEKEIADRSPQVISCNDSQREVTLIQNVGGKHMSRTFRYDRVFGPDSTQERLFKQAVVPIVEEVLDGFNCTIFAYGQTGTGKTFTMEGGPRKSNDGKNLSSEAGVIPRAVKHIFDTIVANSLDSTVKVSFLELYNEELTDLLSFDDDKDGKKLRLLEDRSGVVVQGLEEVIVKNATEIYQVLDHGSAKRKTAETFLNKHSSRSHSIFTITIHLKENTPEGEDVIKIGKLNLVDLAGSENISRSGAKDGRAREAGSINQSLLTLGRVITALVEHSGHVPYRDSKLTRLLRDSLGGKTKTCIIATIAPTVQCQEETISTLDYAHRAKNIRNKPEVNQKISKTTMIGDMAAEIERMRSDLLAAREKSGVYLPTDRFEQMQLEQVQLREQVKALKGILEEEECSHKKELEDLAVQHKRQMDRIELVLLTKEKELADAIDRVTDANLTIQEQEFFILSHERAERALAGHATVITDELKLCSNELKTFSNKFDESFECQTADREALSSVQHLVSSKVKSLAAFVSAETTKQHNNLISLATQLATAKVEKEQEMTAMLSMVDTLKASAESMQQDLLERLGLTSNQAEASVSDLAAHAVKFIQEYQASSIATTEAASQALLACSNTLGNQMDMLHTLAESNQQHSISAAALLKQTEASLQSCFADLWSKAEHLKASSNQRADVSQKAMAAAKSSLSEQLIAGKEAVLQQVAAMLSSFAEQQHSSLLSTFGQISSQADDDLRALDQEVGEVMEAANRWNTNAKVSLPPIRSQLEDASSHLVAGTAAVAAAVTDCSSQVACLSNSTVEQCRAQAQSLESHTQDVCSELKDVGSKVKDAVDAHSAFIRSESANTLAKHAALEQHIQNFKANDHTVLSTVGAGLTSVSGSLGIMTNEHDSLASGTGAAVTEVVSGRLEVKPVTAADVPVKRVVNVPADSSVEDLMCPPVDVLRSEYQRERTQILRRGGDPRRAHDLVSPFRQLDLENESQPTSPNAGSSGEATFAKPGKPLSSRIPMVPYVSSTPQKKGSVGRGELVDVTNKAVN